jgi:hypothetical protein
MKIITLSFELNNNNMVLDKTKRVSIISETVKSEKPDLLVTSGYSLEDNDDLENLQLELKNIQSESWLLVEVAKEESIIKYGHPLVNKYPNNNLEPGTHNLYVITNENKLLNLGPQYFAQSQQVTGQKNKYMIEEFENILDNRVFKIKEKNVLVLCCGEINSIQGRDNINYISEKVKRFIEDSDIILNPTHDCMANYGTLKAKRIFLSQREDKNAIYLNSSNWNTYKNQNPDKNTFMQNIYRNGEKIEAEKRLEKEYLMHLAEIEV